MPRKTINIGSRTIALDARPDRLDLRDRQYHPKLGNLPSHYPGDADAAEWLPAYAAAKLLLDQGSEGACTGFGLSAVINYLRFTRGPPTEPPQAVQVSPAMLYQLARLYDEWPGEDYEGSSCRGALKGWGTGTECVASRCGPTSFGAGSACMWRRPRIRSGATIRNATGTSTRSTAH